MTEFLLESIFGSSTIGEVAYKESTGELFVGVNRAVKKIQIRGSLTKVLQLETEDTIRSISVDKDLLLALDCSGRVYLYSLGYDIEIGRMNTKRCKSAIVKDNKVYLEYSGYLQVWVPNPDGFLSFKQEKHITGHQDTITMIRKTENGILTSGMDGSLRLYPMQGDSSVIITSTKTDAIAAVRLDKEVISIWSSGEITRLLETNMKWTVTQRTFLMKNLLGADISSQGDMAVVIDTNHNISLYSTLTNNKEPLQQIFVSDGITNAKFIEQDDWIVLSGNGSVIWEWKTNTLLFNEQDSIGQQAAHSTKSAVITGTEKGEVFIWDRTSSLSIKKIQAHSSPVIEIIPTTRGFISVSAGGECKVFKSTGELVKEIQSQTTVTVADADDDVLAIAGIGQMEVYDLKRRKPIATYTTNIPLAIKLIGSTIFLVTAEGITKYGTSTNLEITGPESFSLASISGNASGVQICCLGESGWIYTYTEDLDQQTEFRALPSYVNKIGKATPKSLYQLHSNTIVLTYTLVRPDKYTSTRDSLYATLYHSGAEIDKWIVLERSNKDSGKVFSCSETYGTAIGICTQTGVLLFSNVSRGLKPAHLWQKESPEELEILIDQGDVLAGAIGAAKLQNQYLLGKALSQGDPILIGKHFPIELIPSLTTLVLSLITNGLVERSLILLEELLKRTPPHPLLKKQLTHILSSTMTLSMDTTGYIDALIKYNNILTDQ
ncbi:hypothetical protein NEOKW01_0251 [Nematocida sp. AWRm80]|nr:hypothetical protein NEOKW01_0251 [Nematocida sp. AWRm80]